MALAQHMPTDSSLPHAMSGTVAQNKGLAEAGVPVAMWPQRTEVRWSHDWGADGRARFCSVPSSWCHLLHGVLSGCPGSALGDELKRVWTMLTTPKGLSAQCPSAAVLHLCSRGQASPKLQRGQNVLVPWGQWCREGVSLRAGIQWGQLAPVWSGGPAPRPAAALIFCRVFGRRHPLGPPPLPGFQGSGKVPLLLRDAVALNYLLL